MKIWVVVWAPEWHLKDTRVATVGARTMRQALDEAEKVARKAGYLKVVISKAEHTTTIDRVAR